MNIFDTFLFHARNRKDLMEKTSELGYQIIKHVIKCVLMSNFQSYQHWIDEIIEWIMSQSAKKPKSGSFSYRWFFIDYTPYDKHRTKIIIDRVLKRYNKVKYNPITYTESDIDLINRTLTRIENELESAYKRNKDILTEDQVVQIITECLPQNI